MKYILTGGGTGGHIYPALAIGDEIKKQDKEAEILYVGTEDSLESEIVPKSGYNFETVRVKGLPRKINKKFFIAIKELFLGLNDARKILKEFKPDVVIGTGGYVCGPVVIIASLKGIPTMIHEQNAYPGITNKILSRFVDTVAITFDEARKHFKNQKKIVNTGNPIRSNIFKIDKNDAYEKLNVNKEDFLILSFGGSGGQKSLNDSILENLMDIPSNIQLIHITGNRLYDDFNKGLKERNITFGDNIKILPYLYDMPEALNIADLVITPAGAITLAEISGLGLASILVPKSYTAENHQEFNAESFYNNNASELIYEKDLSGKKLREVVCSMVGDNKKLEEIRKNSKKLGKVGAAEEIYEEISKLSHNG